MQARNVIPMLLLAGTLCPTARVSAADVDGRGLVVRIRLENEAITPVTARFIERSLREAEHQPMAMQMRILQTLVEIGSENNSTIVFPLPLELTNTFLQAAPNTNGRPNPERSESGRLAATSS